MNGVVGKLGGNVATETELKKLSITRLENYRRSAEARGGHGARPPPCHEQCSPRLPTLPAVLTRGRSRCKRRPPGRRGGGEGDRATRRSARERKRTLFRNE